MSELVSFEDAARELGATTEEVSRLVRMGKLKTAERGGLLMITRNSVISQKAEVESAPLELAEEPKPATEGVAALRLAPEADIEEVSAEEEKKPAAAAAPQPPGEKTESIFGDVELETFAEVPAEGEAAGEEVGQLEEAGEELGAEEVAQLAQAGAPVARRGGAAPPETSTAVTVLLVLTFILLLFAGLVIFNFGLSKSQVIFDPIQSWLGGAAK